MTVRGKPRRLRTAPIGEALESRQLLAGSAPARPVPAAEVQPLARAAPPPKAPSLFMEPTAGRQPILAAIDSARRQIRLGICNFDDPVMR